MSDVNECENPAGGSAQSTCQYQDSSTITLIQCLKWFCIQYIIRNSVLVSCFFSF